MRGRTIVIIVVVAVLALCCGAVACTPIGSAVGVNSPVYDDHDRKSHKAKKSKKVKKKCVAKRNGKCTRYA